VLNRELNYKTNCFEYKKKKKKEIYDDGIYLQREDEEELELYQ
jgi:hypothetical protein